MNLFCIINSVCLIMDKFGIDRVSIVIITCDLENIILCLTQCVLLKRNESCHININKLEQILLLCCMITIYSQLHGYVE